METNDSTALLDNLVIAAPCQVPWASMEGDDRVRDCSQCSRKVYNLSNMNRREAEDFLAKYGTSQCATFYRRADGTIMTDNCPVGLRKLRDRCRAVLRIAGGFLAFFLALPSAFAHRSNDGPPSVLQPGRFVVQPFHKPGAKTLQTAGYVMLVWPILTAPVIKQPNERPLGMLGRINEPEVKEPPLVNGKNGLPNDDDSFGSGAIRLRAEKSVGADSRAYRLYLKARENEENGKHLVAATYYTDALKTMTESALDALNDSPSYDPKFKQAIEEHLTRLHQLFSPEPSTRSMDNTFSSGASAVKSAIDIIDANSGRASTGEAAAGSNTSATSADATTSQSESANDPGAIEAEYAH